MTELQVTWQDASEAEGCMLWQPLAVSSHLLLLSMLMGFYGLPSQSTLPARDQEFRHMRRCDAFLLNLEEDILSLGIGSLIIKANRLRNSVLIWVVDMALDLFDCEPTGCVSSFFNIKVFAWVQTVNQATASLQCEDNTHNQPVPSMGGVCKSSQGSSEVSARKEPITLLTTKGIFSLCKAQHSDTFLMAMTKSPEEATYNTKVLRRLRFSLDREGMMAELEKWV